MALRSLTGVSGRYLRQRPGRSAVTTLGIALGVAVFFGVTVSNASINGFYQRAADQLTGRSDITAQVIGGGDSPMDDGLTDRVRHTPGVAAATGSLFTTASANVTISRRHFFSIAGTDFSTAVQLESLPLSQGRLPRAGAREILLPSRLAQELHVRAGSDLELTIKETTAHYTVAGILHGGGLGFFSGGQLGFMPLDVVQAAVGHPRSVGTTDVALRKGVRPDRWLEAHRDLFGPGVNVTDTAAALQPLRRTFEAPSRGFLALSTLALWLGVFLIYLSVSMNVLERTRLFGGLFALGATRRQVARIVVIEAGLLGLVGSVVGLGLGIGLSTVLVRLTAQWFNLQPPPLIVSPIAAVVGMIAGCLMTLIASALPARRAARLSAVEALRTEAEAQGRPSRTWVAGVPLLAVGIALLPSVAAHQAATLAASVALLLGSVLVVPPVLAPVARLLGRLTERIERGTGRVAVMHLVKERSRSALTLGLVMVVLAITIGLSAATAASRQVNDHQLAAQFGADVRVFHDFDAASIELIRSTPGVARIAPVAYTGATSLIIDAPTEPARIEAIQPSTYFDVSGFAWGDGDAATARAALAAGGSVLMPLQTALHLHLRRGGTVRLATTSGPRPFRVAATYVGLVSGPNIVVSGADGRAFFGVTGPTELDLRAARGVSAEAIQSAITKRLGKQADTYGFSTAAQIAANVRTGLRRATGLYNALLFVCLLVSMLGLGNTLAMSMYERRREIGVLRAIGTARRSVARMVLTESATLVLVALVLALPLGVATAALTINVIAGTFGFEPAFVYPWRVIPGLVLIAAAVSLVAALIPARRASRVDIIDALRLD